MHYIRASFFGIWLLAGMPSAMAAPIDISQKPVFLNPPDPRVMLVMSRDHELYKKAYTDYSDLDGGGLETTYKDSINYYGYFDSKRCYTYSASNKRFEPANAGVGPNLHHCSSAWSGNFMNWATMTRMDIARKVLYGGLRSTDNIGSALGDTVLERAMLPSDVHAFAKVFAPSGGSTEMQLYTPIASAEITLCNVSKGAMGTISKDIVPGGSEPPLVRIVSGAWSQWAASEIVQCRVNNDSGSDTDYTTRPASSDYDYSVRVAVCVPGKLESNCKAYSTATKPTGLLQKYGDADANSRIRFGLMTGSYANNKKGGVLRRNVSPIAGNATAADNEIDSASGKFLANPGIIDTISKLQISKFKFGHDLSGTPNQYIDPTCNTPGKSSFPNGDCPDWGNPLSEMYLETLRYFANGGTPTSGFDTTDAGYMEGSKTLPSATWADPLPSTDWCAVSNIVVLSTGLNSFDGDDLGTVPASTLPAFNVKSLTDKVGTLEGIAGATVLAGGTDITSGIQCTGKSTTNLSNIKGICPEIPAQEGTYTIAGLANAARDVDLRPLYQSKRLKRWNNINADWVARQPITTYTVALAESLPTFSVQTQNNSTIKFLPACQAHGTWTPCTLTDVRVESATATGGSFLAVWEDSQWGYDYDMDAISRVSWCVGSSCTPAVAANEVKFTISIPQKVSGAQMRFGISVTGTSADGISSMLMGPGSNYNCTDSACTSSTPASAPTPLNITYAAGASSSITLKNPLWYAAKYGTQSSIWDLKDKIPPLSLTTGDNEPDNFFEVSNPALLEESLSEVFDNAAVADASASAIASNSTRLDTTTHVYQAMLHSPAWTGELTSIPLDSKGVPQAALWKASQKIPTTRNITTWNGQAWTSTASGGRDFLWGDLNATQQAGLDPTAFAASATSSDILDYLRGVQTKEKSNTGGIYRTRKSLLGDIVNSDPHFVAAENYGYDEPGSGVGTAEQTAYTLFRTDTTVGVVSKVNRPKMIYVGANDGMLHAFNAADGVEKFAYVPSTLISSLNLLTSPNYQHRYFVDGSPNSGDAYLGGAWKTVLLGTLGAGGRGVFALDITDPTTFDKSKIMWEYTDANLGYVMSRAFVALMNDNNWYAIFANGYNSPSGTAALYIVPLDNTLGIAPQIINVSTTSDGLSEPALLDTNGDYKIDTIYAGSLAGTVWKFDVSSTTASDWILAAKRLALFTTTDGTKVQPITGALEIGSAPTGTSGYMIYFGTGKYLGSTDVGDTSTQTAYGILDSGTAIGARGTSLHNHTFVYEGNRSASDTTQVRVVSNTTFSYTGGSAKRGWYLDLLSPNSPAKRGERVVSTPLLRFGRAIFTSIVPSSGPCEQGGYSWITEIDALTGARLTYSVFDFNDANDTFDSSDFADYLAGTPVSSTKLDSEGLMKSPTVISAGEREYKIGSGTAGGIIVIQEKGDKSTPRTSWRQIFQP